MVIPKISVKDVAIDNEMYVKTTRSDNPMLRICNTQVLYLFIFKIIIKT